MNRNYIIVGIVALIVIGVIAVSALSMWLFIRLIGCLILFGLPPECDGVLAG